MTNDSKDLEGNLDTCSTPDRWSEWFEEAEASTQAQWDTVHWHRIKDEDLSTVLELAPGAGRFSERLKEHAKTLYLVDLNEYALNKCRARFADDKGPCEIEYIKTDGVTLPGVADESVTLVFSWDSMVHMDKAVNGAYLKEFARVMKPGAFGLVHHSNHGARSDESDIHKNPHMRSNQSRENFRAQAEAAGLEVPRQDLLDWDGIADLDCVTAFRKPA
ncbi:MAG: class I SAM-dependent methyltransferase [Planctomycetota bacterium]